MTLLFLTTGCHLIANAQRVWKAESRSPSTVTHPLVPCPLFPCLWMLPWPGTATASLLGSLLHPQMDTAMSSSTIRNQPVPGSFWSGGTSRRMKTERAVRLCKSLPKEVMESTSELITVEPLSCKKVSPQRGNSSRIDVLTFLSVTWDKG